MLKPQPCIYIIYLMPRPPNVPLLRALWSLLDGIWGLLKGSWGCWIHIYTSGLLLNQSLLEKLRAPNPSHQHSKRALYPCKGTIGLGWKEPSREPLSTPRILPKYGLLYSPPIWPHISISPLKEPFLLTVLWKAWVFEASWPLGLAKGRRPLRHVAEARPVHAAKQGLGGLT